MQHTVYPLLTHPLPGGLFTSNTLGRAAQVRSLCYHFCNSLGYLLKQVLLKYLYFKKRLMKLIFHSRIA